MKRLAEIIYAYECPGLDFASVASQAAFGVLQHADTASRLKYLPSLRDSVGRYNALGAHLTMIEDLVLIAQSKRQTYGSQLSQNPLRFDPIEDNAHVDERRRRIGLEPMADYAWHFGLTYIPGASFQ